MNWRIGAVLCCLAAVGAAQAGQTGSITVPAGATGNWWGDPGGARNTGFRIYNGMEEEVIVSYEDGLDKDCDGLAPPPPGFVMLDGTLTVSSAMRPEARKLALRMEYSRARLRSSSTMPKSPMERTAPTEGCLAASSPCSCFITAPIFCAFSISLSSSYTRIVASAAAQPMGWLL